MIFWSNRIKDADGRRVPLVRYEALLPGESEAVRSGRISRAAKDGRLTRREKSGLLIAGVVVFPLAIGGTLLALTFIARDWNTLFFGFFFVPFPPAVIGMLYIQRIFAQRVANEYVRAGLCASCGYELQGIDAEPDGITKCPECSARWRMIKFRR